MLCNKIICKEMTVLAFVLYAVLCLVNPVKGISDKILAPPKTSWARGSSQHNDSIYVPPTGSPGGSCTDLYKCFAYGRSICVNFVPFALDYCDKYCYSCDCYDKIPNCADYSNKCTLPYRTWALKNCARSCNLCAFTNVTCFDESRECETKGKDWCKTNPALAKVECNKYCGFCTPDLQPWCTDARSDCSRYGPDVCTNYPLWSEKNCFKYCHHCDPFGKEDTSCQDRRPDCDSHLGTCKNDTTASFARYECPKTCGLCGPSLKLPTCRDEMPSCDDYDYTDLCVNNTAWAKERCAKYCKLCIPDPTTVATPKNFCDSHPCQNNARCLDDQNGYICLCPGGFTGKNCETRICSTHPCQHNGRCLDDQDGYICLCGSGFTGTNCETRLQDLPAVGKR